LNFNKCVLVIRELLRRAPLALAAAMLTLLILSSRPTADEHLVAGVFRSGRVVDSDFQVYEPSGSTLLDWFVASWKLGMLGWDSPVNLFFTQVPASFFLNTFPSLWGPLLGTALSVATLVALHFIARFLGQRAPNANNLAILWLALNVALLYLRFSDDRQFAFNLYPLLGIRFGFYAVHPIVVFALFLAITDYNTSTDHPQGGTSFVRKFVFLSVLLSFVSLWAFCFLCSLLVISVVLQVGRKTISVSLRSFGAVFLAGSIVFLGFVPILKRGGLGIGQSRSIRELSRIFFTQLIDFEEAIQVLLGPGLVGFSSGFGLVVFGKLSPSLTRIPHLASCCFVFLLLAWPLFSFLETVTYRAYWHKTTPGVFSFLASLVIGVWAATVVSAAWSRRQLVLRIVVVAASLLGGALAPAERSLRSIDSFRRSWDSGNYTASDSPIRNEYGFNWANILLAYDQSKLPDVFWEDFIKFLDDSGRLVPSMFHPVKLEKFCQDAQGSDYVMDYLRMEVELVFEVREEAKARTYRSMMRSGKNCESFFRIVGSGEPESRLRVSILDTKHPTRMLGQTFVYPVQT